MNLKKCHFIQESISYLGHVVFYPCNISVAAKNTHELQTAKSSKPQTELRYFWGCATCIAASLRVSLR
jgi:hypothetical protein